MSNSPARLGEYPENEDEIDGAPIELDQVDDEDEYIEFSEEPQPSSSSSASRPYRFFGRLPEPGTLASMMKINRMDMGDIGEASGNAITASGSSASATANTSANSDEDDPDAFKWEDGPHPLLIPDVLRDIFGRLGMQDVERCRLISRVWNEEASSVLQSKKIVALLELDSVKYYIDKMGTTPYFPHSSFELHVESIFEQDTMLKFWAIFGSHIKCLDLRQCTLFIDTLFDIIDRFLPNLERLALRTLPRKLSPRKPNQSTGGLGIQHFAIYQNQAQPREDFASLRFYSIKELTLCWCAQDEENSIIIMKDLLRSMPNLERLLVTDIPSLSGAAVGGAAPGIGLAQLQQQPAVGSRARVARFLVQVLTDPTIQLPQLKIIDFPIEIGNTELTKLTGKGYQFNSLSLKLTSGTKSSFLKDFLNSVSGSLQYLEVSFPDGFFVGGVTFPAYSQMKNHESIFHLAEIRELTLTNFTGPLENLKNLRKLKTVSLNGAKLDYFANVKMLVPKSFDHPLWCLKTDSPSNPGVSLSISECFPLLRVIKVSGLDDNGLGIIYRNLPYIIELEILKGKVSDQGLSGVPLEVCKDMAETATFHFVDPARFRCDLFLGSLQYLKTLNLVCDDVSDISIVFGIVDCKNLERLTLHSPSISDVGLIKIADRMVRQLHYLDIHECENVSEEGKFYVKEKLKHIELILEPYAVQKQKSTDNPYRQIGFPYRARSIRPERFAGAVGGALGAEDDYDRLPLRERMFMAMDRRRRFVTLRMIQRVGRAPAANLPGMQENPPIIPPPLAHPNEDELRFMMDIHPIFHEDEAAANFLMNFDNIGESDSDTEDDVVPPGLPQAQGLPMPNNMDRFGFFAEYFGNNAPPQLQPILPMDDQMPDDDLMPVLNAVVDGLPLLNHLNPVDVDGLPMLNHHLNPDGMNMYDDFPFHLQPPNPPDDIEAD